MFNEYREEQVLLNGGVYSNVDTFDLEVTLKEFKQQMERALREEGRLNTMTQVIVNNIISLYDTALQCKQNIKEHGVMITEIDVKGNPKMKRNEAVTLQEKNIMSIAKLLNQLGLDALQEELESEI